MKPHLYLSSNSKVWICDDHDGRVMLGRTPKQAFEKWNRIEWKR